MKSSLISIFLLTVLVTSLLVTPAFASGIEDPGDVVCQNYDQLVDALSNPNTHSITIWGKWETIDGSGDYSYFDWGPSGQKTLLLANKSIGICINDDLTIPANITVEVSCPITIGGDATLTVNGDWYAMSTSATLSSGTAIFNGDVYIMEGYTTFYSPTTFNGTVNILGNNFSVRSATLGSGARVTGKKLTVQQSLTCPTDGSAVVESELMLSAPNSSQVTLSGALTVNSITFSSSNVVFAANSRVCAASMSRGSNTITINGDLTLGRNKHHGLSDNHIVINEGGTLTMRPGSQLGSTDSSGSMSGDGTLKLYADIHEVSGNFTFFPQLYGIQTNNTISEKVTVKNIWKNWVDAADCTHDWEQGAVVPATCKSYAYTLFTCTLCGFERLEEDKTGGYSDIHSFYWYTSGSTIGHRCNLCSSSGSRGSVTLAVSNGLYTGQPVTGVASAQYSETWKGGEVTFSYENNVEPGENTAKVYMHYMGQKVSATFSIFKDCAHNGGTATCFSPAICETCQQSYGSTLSHSYTTTYDHENHYRSCTNEGCTEETTAPHQFTNHVCYPCGYGFYNIDEIKENSLTVMTYAAKDDMVVAAVYSEEGQFLGCDLQVATSSNNLNLEVPFTQTPSTLRIFTLLDGYTVNRDAAERSLQTR